MDSLWDLRLPSIECTLTVKAWLMLYLHRLLRGRSMHRRVFTRQMPEPELKVAEPEIRRLMAWGQHTQSEEVSGLCIRLLSKSSLLTKSYLQMCTNWQGWKDVVSVFYQSSEGSEKYKWGKDAKSETSCSWYAENPRRNLALHKPVLTSRNTQFSSLPSAFILVFFLVYFSLWVGGKIQLQEWIKKILRVRTSVYVLCCRVKLWVRSKNFFRMKIKLRLQRVTWTVPTH